MVGLEIGQKRGIVVDIPAHAFIHICYQTNGGIETFSVSSEFNREFHAHFSRNLTAIGIVVERELPSVSFRVVLVYGQGLDGVQIFGIHLVGRLDSGQKGMFLGRQCADMKVGLEQCALPVA